MKFTIPEQLHCNKGWQFESKLIVEFCCLLQTEKMRTAPYHPQSNGFMVDMLSTWAKKHPFEWEDDIRKVCMAYNSSIQASIR